MQPQTKPSPLVMLILRPYVINTCCPKTLPLETTLAALNNLLRFHYVQETPDKFPGQLSEERKKALDGYTHRGARTPCDIRSDFRIASTPRSGKRSRISRTSS